MRSSGTGTPAPLAGVHVVEIGTGRAGAFAGAILADLGADVVKIESSREDDGSPRRRSHRIAYDRGKRSVAAEPAAPGADDLLERLLGWADVLLEEDPAWRADRSAPLDALVHCSISAYGSAAAACRPAPDPDSEDLLVQALSGNMDLTGHEGGPPGEAGVPVADLCAGVYAAIGALGGVLAGGGHRVEVSKTDVAVALLSYMAVGWFADGEVPTRVGTGHSTIFPYNSFEAADGEVVAAPFTQRFWRNFATAIGREDLPGREEYRDFARRLVAKEELLGLFAPPLREKTVAEWVAAFAEADVPAGPVLSLADALDLEHTVVRGMSPTVDGSAPPVRTVASPFRFRAPNGTAFRPVPRVAPQPGADTARVRAELAAEGVR
ncbi:CaiB/BaiF CoA transferase family protein [Pseudonocardia halophobica]|uniref:CaiB/BaiF CoA transferase family protein n=1 Tax=Pseudonocardia halophobica TaxID=29401 RepID=UPI003D8C061A